MEIKEREPQGIPTALPGLHPVLQRIYAARAIEDIKQLDRSLQALLPFHMLMDIDKAVLRLEQALRQQEKIIIVGDFDADGATSSALAYAALRQMGARQVEFLVPNRFSYGYGLSPAIVALASQSEPDLIITVDNGIASFEGVEAANSAGIDVIVTDHHLPGDTLPAALAIVNPNQQGDPFPSKSIAGVGVIFYLMLALRRHLSQQGYFQAQGIKEPNMALFLDLVALGTVADVVPLDQNNRILIQQGIQRIRQGLCRPGIQALIEVAGKQLATLRETDLGFSVAPRLNAAGRLDDMSLGIACLLEENLEEARRKAAHLDALNVERRKIEAEMKDQAIEAIDKLSLRVDSKAQQLPAALCLFDRSWHQGVIGILAGRLKDRYHRPVIALAEVSATEVKGSARSIPGINIRDVLAAVDRDNPGLLTKFGGHAMAAGLSFSPEALPRFKQAFVAEVTKQLDLSQHSEAILTDGPLTADELNRELADLIHAEGPWGQQFPEPAFHNVFELLDQRIVGQQHLKLTLQHPEGSEAIDAIAFNVDPALWPNHRARYIQAVYKLDINRYNGRSKLQLIIHELKAQ